jgi:hypothetical protein
MAGRIDALLLESDVGCWIEMDVIWTHSVSFSKGVLGTLKATRTSVNFGETNF